MVKISELNNRQLLKQIEKYNKIVDQLYNEREKRLDKGAKKDELLTVKEKKEIDKQRQEQQKSPSSPKEFDPTQPGSETDSPYQLDFDQEELDSFQQKTKDVKEKEGEEEVRVTQLLKLSKEDMAELQKGKKEKKKKK